MKGLRDAAEISLCRTATSDIFEINFTAF